MVYFDAILIFLNRKDYQHERLCIRDEDFVVNDNVILVEVLYHC